MTAIAREAAVGGHTYGIINTGYRAVNTLIQVRVVDNSALAAVVAELAAREVPLLGTFPEDEPVGRTAIIDQVAAEIAAGISVQLFGAGNRGQELRQPRQRPAALGSAAGDITQPRGQTGQATGPPGTGGHQTAT